MAEQFDATDPLLEPEKIDVDQRPQRLEVRRHTSSDSGRVNGILR
jgi:hypothetical protein